MKLFKEIVATLKVLLLLAILLFIAGARAQAQTGTYVLPRPVVLFSGTVTNGQSLTNIFTGTNFLNYSGYHRLGLWATYTSTNAGNFTSNSVLYVDFSPGSGAGYTSTLLSTNTLWSTTSPVQWTIPCAGAGTQVVFTNLDWQFSDTVQYFKGTRFTTTSTNAAGFQLEIDGVVTP